LITCAVVLGYAANASAETWTVDDDGPADFDNIQSAVEAASDGDEIVVSPGVYTSTNDAIVIIENKLLTLQSSEGPEETIIDGVGKQQGMRILSCSPEISGFTIRNCIGYEGGGIYCIGSNALISNCIITENRSLYFGGGICCEASSSANITNCVISNNYGEGYGGGGIYCYASPFVTVSNCLITGNFGGGQGGGILAILCTVSISNCTVSHNITQVVGGSGIHCLVAQAIIDTCEISNNSGGNAGCAFYGLYGNGQSTISLSEVCGNLPDQISGVEWSDEGGNTIADDCMMCNGDITGDGHVGVDDLLAVIASWNDPYTVNDLLTVIANWGACP
jgi:hypothetical protein